MGYVSLPEGILGDYTTPFVVGIVQGHVGESLLNNHVITMG